MPFGETLRVALRSLRANVLRSLLTMLGVVIGVGAVIAMLALGNGARQAVRSRIAALGTTRLTINARRVFRGGVQTADTRRLMPEDVDMLRARAHLITAIAPQQDRELIVVWHEHNTSTRIVGTTPSFLPVRRFHIAAGHMFTDADNRARRRVAVLGATALRDLGFEGPVAALGQHVRIRGVDFEVIGTLAPSGLTGGWGDPDDQVLIPLMTGRFEIFGTPRLNDIHVLAPSEAQIPATMAEVERILRRAHRIPAGEPDDFRIRSQLDYLETLGETTKTFALLLAGIAGVSLLVGGVGIMNIMLVSVTERTREIGTRKALGATKRNILLQFLIEALILCTLGGVIGIAAGLGSAAVLRDMFRWNTSVTAGTIALAFAFAAAIGLIFGVWPARQAAGLDPVEALRYE